ncbi:negative elongation factor D-like [Tropilaelaps mercedesae]|uniref:Negative elongation factor D-like n=1 Tax=Tropilaelaps mercedesae TaxID=418985 RepID=A0A1V9XPA3_9ACAR|nr:negative elongation factor D-like [Tropilaelaps mercedesae]
MASPSSTSVEEIESRLGARDSIMEPSIFRTLKQFLQAGGDPERAVELLIGNYHAVAQTANLLAEWLIMSGMEINEVQSLVESQLENMLVRHFEPSKADAAIFGGEGETPAWLAQMIDHPAWRKLIYRLAEEYPDCLMLNFTIKLISDAGFQAEITSISTASQQLEVFSRVLRTALSGCLEKPPDEERLTELAKLIGHGEHTYLYAQCLLHALSLEGMSRGGASAKRLAHEIRKRSRPTRDTTPIAMTLSGALKKHPKACQAMAAMLGKNALNPADVTILFNLYKSNDPPPVDLIREPTLLELLLDALFKPGSRLNPDHKPKYIFLLAYAASVFEQTTKKGPRRAPVLNKDELARTQESIEQMCSICAEPKICDLPTLYDCVQLPVMALAAIHWARYVVNEASYFKLNTEHVPMHFALLDEVAICQPTLHDRLLRLYSDLFEKPFDAELDVLVLIEIRKMLLDRMIHLVCRGCVLSVLRYITARYQRQDTDISLIRYFVTELLDVIGPPYTAEFVANFLPLVENKEITGDVPSAQEGPDLVGQFIQHASKVQGAQGRDSL